MAWRQSGAGNGRRMTRAWTYACARTTAPAARPRHAAMPAAAAAPNLPAPKSKPRRERRGKGRRSGFGRLIYWGAVLALWALDRRDRTLSSGSASIFRPSNRSKSPSVRRRF